MIAAVIEFVGPGYQCISKIERMAAPAARRVRLYPSVQTGGLLIVTARRVAVAIP